MKSKFDEENNVGKWSKRLKLFSKEVPEDIKDPMVDDFCDTIADIIEDAPSETGLTRAGWVKPLREEGKDIPNLLGDNEDIPKEKREEYIKKGEKNSFYFKDLETRKKSFYIEVVNTNKGALFQEYGDSRNPPTGIIRKHSRELQDKVKKSIGKVLQDLGDKK